MKPITFFLRAALAIFAFALLGGAHAGVLTTLQSFNSSDGQYPQATLVPGTNGSFYGTTYYGGTYANGVVFQVTTNGAFTPLVSFANTNGGNPIGRLVVLNGVLYGTTANGGPFNHGTVFQLSASNTIVPQLVFTNYVTEGTTPMSGLTVGTNGTLFGTTASGGPNGYGTVFKMYPGDSQPTVLKSFDGISAASPEGALLLNTNGNFYGTTLSGGSNNFGTIFKISPDGIYTNFFSFAMTNGAYPWCGLVQCKNGMLYGTTANGPGGYGTVFRITTNDVVEMVAAFASTNGANPHAELVEGQDGSLYGVAVSGGANARGTIFKVTTNSTLLALHSFNYADGSQPYGGLVFGDDGHLYGTTLDGGTGSGTIFRYVLNPPAPVIQSVTQTNGTATLIWSAVAGGGYQLQYKTNLAQTGWLNLGFAATATNSIMYGFDPVASDAERYYRVGLLQP